MPLLVLDGVDIRRGRNLPRPKLPLRLYDLVMHQYREEQRWVRPETYRIAVVQYNRVTLVGWVGPACDQHGSRDAGESPVKRLKEVANCLIGSLTRQREAKKRPS